MSVLTLLSRLEALEISLQLVNNDLKINSPKGRLTKDLVDELRAKKKEVVEFLQTHLGKQLDYTTIEPVEAKEYYALSPAQKRLYIVQQMGTHNISYNMPYVFPLSETIDPGKLAGIFKTLIRRHESLRTCFITLAGEPFQRLEAEVELVISQWWVASGEEESIETILGDFVRPFDLSRAPLLRVGLIHGGETENLLVLDMHHIVTDGTSQKILKEEFSRLYHGETLPVPGIRYRDYSQWLNRSGQQERVKSQEAYWLRVFSDQCPVLNLPLDFARPEVQDFSGRSVSFRLDQGESKHLKEICAETGATLYMVLLSVVYILLSKLSGLEDLVVGTPVAARRHPGLQQVIGMFVNTLVMRNAPAGDKTVNGFLKEVKQQSLKAYENQEYPFEELVEKVLTRRDTSRNPLFDVMFNLLNQEDYPQEPTLDREDHPGYREYTKRTSKFDLNFTALDLGEGIVVELEYCGKLFKESTIQRFSDYFKQIIHRVSTDKGATLARIEIIPAEEKELLLRTFNDTGADFPGDKTIHRLFAEQVERTPENIAVAGPIQTKSRTYMTGMTYISYRELNRKSNRVAHLLREKGVKPDTLVGLRLERSLEMIIGILGILKAGGAYLPIDGEYPRARQVYMLKDSGINLLLADYDHDPGEPIPIPGGVKWVDLRAEGTAAGGPHGPVDNAAATNLVYMIYTSGSTGKPKGVLLEHRNLVNLLIWNSRSTRMDFSSVLQFATICFDASFHEIFSTLLSGGKLCLIQEQTRTDIPGLLKILAIHKIKTLFLPMSMLKVIFSEKDYIEQFPGCVRHIQTAGEQVVINDGLRDFLRDNKVFLHNHYGPSETHVVTALTLSPTAESPTLPPIGQPVANTKIYILDNDGNLQPLGVPGELSIGGTQVGRGYLNQPELTLARFIHHNLSVRYSSSHRYYRSHRSHRSYNSYESYIYRTGDLACWLPEGNIRFLGRIDQQVKIRGFRVELGEIENQLIKHEKIKEAVVIPREVQNGEKDLCAYLVTREKVQIGQLREYLSAALPAYMIPAFFVFLEEIPVTSSGKTDRKALPEPGPVTDKEYAAPRTKIEKKLAGIWSELLAVEKNRIGIDANFFQLGGHSLRATVMAARIHKAFNIKLTLTEVFKHQTIRQLAQYLRAAAKNKYAGIEPVEKREYYELSSAQERIYFIQQMEVTGTAYNMPMVLSLRGKVGKAGLEFTLKQLIGRHESLRTSFAMIGEKPVQRIHTKVDFEIRHWGFKNDPLGVKVEEFFRPFDLSKAPLLRSGLIGHADGHYTWLLDLHHIISDGTSQTLLREDFISLFRGKEPGPLRLHYKDFSQWQKGLLTRGASKAQQDYWLTLYADTGEIPRLDLPTDFRRPDVFNFAGSHYAFKLDREDGEAFKALAARDNGTLYMNLLAALNALFYRYSGQTDIIVGSGIAGRPHADLQKVIGIFINILAMRNWPRGEKPYDIFLKEVITNSIEAFENQDVQFEDLVELLKPRRDLSRNPLFDICLVVQNYEKMGEESLKDQDQLHFSPVETNRGYQGSKFDMTFFITEAEEDIYFNIEYYTGLFKEETIRRMVRHFKKLIKSISREPGIKLKDIDILSEEEKRQVLYEFNDTDREDPGSGTIHERFARQVERTPDHVALSGQIPNQEAACGEANRRAKSQELRAVTYNEMNEKAGGLACLLKDKGVQADTIVGIMVERSIEMVVGIFGILKAGGAYLPLDRGYPEGRIDYMLKDSKTQVLVVDDTSCASWLSLAPGALLYLSTGHPLDFPSSQLPLFPSSLLGSLAYIIYTSGSTGRPKGVAVEHHSLVNLCSWHTRYYSVNSGDRATQYADPGFDASVWEIFPYLLCGASVYIVPGEIKPDIQALNDYFEKNHISISFLPTQLCELFMTIANRGLRLLLTGGDQLKRFIKRHYQLFNNYGPTENTVVAASYPVTALSANIPIGKPVDNNQIYILDRHNHLQPREVPGELCIGGSSLSRGYLNNPGLTRDRFLLFSRSDKTFRPYLSQKIYKTGDLARWRRDGNIEFLGRSDQQVKIRGFRIEPGEIENRLLMKNGINDAVVLAKEKPGGDKFLCAYIVSRGEFEPLALRTYLSMGLPDFMIPSAFIRLERIPLTPNGKIDRQALPDPEIKAGEEYTAPRNNVEEQLEETWCRLLGVKQGVIGIDRDFFQVGGHSLKATVMAAQIYETFHVSVSLAEIFKTPTLRAIAFLIQTAAGGKEPVDYTSLEPVEEKEYYVLSPAQKRLYIIQRMETHNISYNMPYVLPLTEAIDTETLAGTFNALIRRHESLRTGFITLEGEPFQRLEAEVELVIGQWRVVSGEEGSIETILKDFIRPFDLSRAPLLRVGLIHSGETDNILVLDMHHIVTDGISQKILKEEFSRLYHGETLPVPGIRYRDYSQWLNRSGQQERVKSQEAYWLRVFSDQCPVLNLPLDFVRPEDRDFSGRSVSFRLDPVESKHMKETCAETGATLYMAMLSVVNILLSKLSGLEDIIVGTPIAARRHPKLQEVIGMFVNTLAMRNAPAGDKTVIGFLKEVKQQSLKAYENQEYPFEELVEKVLTHRDTSRNPLFDVMFNLLNQEDYPQDITLHREDHPGYHEYTKRTSKFDLNFTAVDLGEGIFVDLEYCSSLFKEDTIRRFIDYFKQIIHRVSTGKDTTLSGIEIIPAEEKERLLRTFNDTGADFPGAKTIHRLFAEQVEQTPGNIAVVGPGQTKPGKSRTAMTAMTYISYRELNRKSNRLAHRLREKGVKPDTLVGLRVERSLEMITGILAILKAGGAYLPIDAEYPRARQVYMLKDSGINLLLTNYDHDAGESIPIPGSVELVDLRVEGTAAGASHDPVDTAAAANLVYMIYTSGSTGRPKGVLLEHRNLVNLLIWNFRATRMDFSSVLQFATICFDASFHEIFSTLLSGGKLCLIQEQTRTDIPGLFKIIERHKIKTLFLPMAVLNVIFSAEDYIETFPPGVAHIQTAGEQVVLNDSLRDFLRENRVFLHNHYGPSETHVVTALTLSPTGEIPTLPPIGQPVANTKIYILDNDGNLQPLGVPGELYIGGPQVGRGYLNQPGLTKDKFCLRRPGGALFEKTAPPGPPGKNVLLFPLPLYQTGDLARWLPDGNIEFLGRIDHQVKIRGFRIELGEIESLLLNHKNVKGAVVLAKEGESRGKYLCAYVAPLHLNEEIDLKELKEYLANRLPRYMVPDYFVILEKIPVALSGKIDREKLLGYGETRPGSPGSSSTPATVMEKIVAGTWQGVLQLAEVGIDDNFFEIGGNSISLLKVHSQLKKVLLVDIPVVKLFKYPTIRSLALFLADAQRDKTPLDRELKLAREITGGKDRLKEKAGAAKTGTGLEIAVIGMSGTFPGAKDLHEFWENLKNGIESIVFFSDDELEEVGISRNLLENPGYVKARGILEGAEYFDAPFFGYTPREVQVMDPQVRIFHQCVWHGLEDAGYDPAAYPGRIGLYAGSSTNIYWEAMTLFSSGGNSLGSFQSMLLRDKDFLCTHISYKLSLKGPSFTVQTACSTSLVAIHLAVQGLLAGECEIALAGGVTVIYPNKSGYIYQEEMINSPDGHCRAFDINSGGIVGGSGAGVVVLKPLAAAAADRDHIYAIIKGSAINNDGGRKVGYTAPSVEGQAEVIRAAQYMADIDPETITYVETHGTGTELGDPVELEALKLAFNTAKKKYCGIGSVKSNVGHMDCAAGVGGFIKTVLSLRHRLIPPSLHFNTPNPKLGLEDSPFYVVSQLKEWKTNGTPLRAGVSSLGIGGTNAHVVLAEWPTARHAPGTWLEDQLILLSAKTPTALQKLTQNLTGHIRDFPGTNLADLAYTLQVGRQPWRFRKICAGSNPGEVVRELLSAGEGFSAQDPPVVFIFSGQGAQYVRMGLEIYRGQPVFRDQMDKGFDILKSLTGTDFKDLFYPRPGSGDIDSIQEQMDDARNSGPIKLIFEYSLAKLLMSWGIRPYAVMGHSFGEYAAACLAGVFSLEDALKLALLRGEFMLRTPPGGMMSVPLSEEQLNRSLQSYPDISLAAVNSTSLCFVSGPSQSLERFEAELREKEIESLHINYPRAAHSHLMKSISGEFARRVGTIKRQEPTIPFMSCLSGDWASPGQLGDPAYWAKHLEQPVRFYQAVEKLLNQPHAIFVQVGPDKGIPLFINRHAGLKPGHLAINMVRHKKDKIPDLVFLLRQLGRLWLHGVKIDWPAFHTGKKPRRISLPAYPFEGKRYWMSEKFFHQVIEQQSQPGNVKFEILEVPQDSSPPSRPGPVPGITTGPGAENYQAPRNELEQNIARVWREVLGFEKIGIYDDFFYLNGDSLTATQLLSHLKKVYPVDLGLKDFFVEPTIAHLAKMIKKLMIQKIKNLSPREREKLAGNRAVKKADLPGGDQRSED